jgi:hypothetical protein
MLQLTSKLQNKMPEEKIPYSVGSRQLAVGGNMNLEQAEID